MGSIQWLQSNMTRCGVLLGWFFVAAAGIFLAVESLPSRTYNGRFYYFKRPALISWNDGEEEENMNPSLFDETKEETLLPNYSEIKRSIMDQPFENNQPLEIRHNRDAARKKLRLNLFSTVL